MRIIENENVFSLKMVGYNDIFNFCINNKVDGCSYLDRSHNYVRQIENKKIGDIFFIGSIKMQLIYKGNNIISFSKYSEKFKGKIIKETYFYKYNLYYSNKKNTLIKKLKSYNELGFLHETNINNIENIYNLNGIYARCLIEKNDVSFNDIANHKVLDCTNDFYKKCARFYLRENTPAHYSFKGNRNERCIFVCDYSIINDKNNLIYITDKIATRIPNKKNLNKDNDLSWLINEMKYDKIYYPFYNEGYDRDYKMAEFLSVGRVDLKYLKAIIFRDENQCLDFINKYPNWNIDVICYPDLLQ